MDLPPPPPLNIIDYPPKIAIYNESHVRVNNCKTLSDGINFINTQQFKDEFSQQTKVNAIILMIESKIDEIIWFGRQEFSSKDWLLVAYKTTQQMIICWRRRGSKTFSKLQFDENYSEDLKNFVLEFLINNLNENKLAPSQFVETDIGLMTLCDIRGYNLLMHAVETENEELFGELLKFPFDFNEQSKSGEFLSDIAWKKKNLKLLLKILNANVPFPKDFNEEEASKEIKEFVEISKELHENIRDIEKVKEIISKYPNLSYFYNIQNVSIAAAAIKLKIRKVYILLLDNDISLSPIEDFDEISKDLDDEPSDDENILTKKCIAVIHNSQSKIFSDKYLLYHNLNSLVGHDEKNEKKRQKLRTEAFEIANSNKYGQLILQLTANCKNLKTRFDFNRDSVHHMYPYNTDSTTDGYILYNKVDIYVGAKKMRIESSVQDKFNIAAVLNHEHCHLALNMTFKNDCKPYSKYDEENERKFTEIVEKCEELKDFDNIIKWVYNCYSEGAWHAELGVRVPHIRTFYQNNSVKLRELEKIYEELFKYFDDVVMPAMRETLKMFEKLSKDSNEISFDDLTKSYQDFIKDSEVEFQSKEVKLKEIFETKDLTTEELRNILNEEVLTVGKKIENIKNEIYIKRNFIHSDFKKNIWYLNVVMFDEANNAQKNFDQILDEVKDSKIFLLSDHAGSGKSTTMRNLAQKIKNEIPQSWVEFVDLKRHIDVYKKYEKYQNVTLEIVIKIFMEILSITSDFDSKVFVNLFKNGQVVLLLDGVDEIAPKYKELFFKIISGIKDLTKNQQWIATRPQHIKELEELLSHKAYKFLPLNRKQTNEMFQNYLNSRCVTIDEEKLETISNQISSIYDNGSNPLMIKMVARLFIAGNSKNFGSKYELYEAMMGLKRDILAEKGPIANQDSNVDSDITLWKIHQIYALKLIYGNEFEDFLRKEFLESKSKSDNYKKEFVSFDKFQIFKKFKKEKSKWTAEAISRCGFLIVHHWNTDKEHPNFVHRTFAEFFVAKFMIEIIQEALEDADDLTVKEFILRMKFLFWFLYEKCISPYKVGFNNIQDFLHDFVSTCPHKIRFSETFLNFLESDEVQKIILRLSKENLKAPLSPLFIKLIRNSDYNERLFNALMIVKDGQSIWFNNFRNNDYKYKFSFFIINLFDFFKNSPFPNWHQFLGLDQSLIIENLNLASDEKIEKIKNEDFLVEGFENAEKRFLWENSDDFQSFKKVYQFFDFIFKVDLFTPDGFKAFLIKYSYRFSLLTLRSKSLIDFYFNAIRKSFNNQNEEIIKCMKLFFSSATGEIKKVQISQKLKKKFLCFFRNVEKILNFDLEIMQELIINGNILTFVSLLKDESLTDLCAKYFGGNQILIKCNNNSILSNIDTDGEMKLLDTFYTKLFNCSTFQFVINHCDNLSLLLNVIEKYKEIYYDSWFAHTGYTLKNNSKTLKINENVKVIEKYDDIYFKVSIIYELLCLINQSENSLSNFEIFFKNLLSEIFHSAINSHKIMIDKVFETLEIFKVSENFENILTNGILNMRITCDEDLLKGIQRKSGNSLESLKHFKEKLAKDSNKLVDYYKKIDKLVEVMHECG